MEGGRQEGGLMEGKEMVEREGAKVWGVGKA